MKVYKFLFSIEYVKGHLKGLRNELFITFSDIKSYKKWEQNNNKKKNTDYKVLDLIHYYQIDV